MHFVDSISILDGYELWQMPGCLRAMHLSRTMKLYVTDLASDYEPMRSSTINPTNIPEHTLLLL